MEKAARTITAAESLRDLGSVMEPDPRVGVLPDQAAVYLARHHEAISGIRLGHGVPEAVAIQFETARNLYLYSWHVYRFYMVAAAHAQSTLVFGLRERLPSKLTKPYQTRHQREPMLAGMLRFAPDQGMIHNEGFRRWHEAAARNARERHRMDAIQQMLDQQLQSAKFDEPDAPEILIEDQRWNLVETLQLKSA
jgi:hypothetical protein